MLYAFSSQEQAAILESVIKNADGIHTKDKIFLLSEEEITSADYGFNADKEAKDKARIGANSAYTAAGGKNRADALSGAGQAGAFWSRSYGYTLDSLNFYAYCVNNDGSVYSVASADAVDEAARPALNVACDKIIFTSATGAKPDGVGSLSATKDASENAWKLTIKDDARNFAITSSSSSGGAITISYSGATPKTAVAPNEYISAVIISGGEITHYGKLAQPTATTGSVSFKLPDGVTLSSSVKLYVFSEQCNGGYATDYASALQEYAEQLPGSSIVNTGRTGCDAGTIGALALVAIVPIALRKRK